MYSPRISEELIPSLYRIGKARKKPMTHIVNEIIRKEIKRIKVIEEKIPVSYETEKVIYRIAEAETKKGTGAVTPAPNVKGPRQ